MSGEASVVQWTAGRTAGPVRSLRSALCCAAAQNLLVIFHWRVFTQQGKTFHNCFATQQLLKAVVKARKLHYGQRGVELIRHVAIPTVGLNCSLTVVTVNTAAMARSRRRCWSRRIPCLLQSTELNTV